MCLKYFFFSRKSINFIKRLKYLIYLLIFNFFWDSCNQLQWLSKKVAINFAYSV